MLDIVIEYIFFTVNIFVPNIKRKKLFLTLTYK
jgi:hypothetical protein